MLKMTEESCKERILERSFVLAQFILVFICLVEVGLLGEVETEGTTSYWLVRGKLEQAKIREQCALDLIFLRLEYWRLASVYRPVPLRTINPLLRQSRAITAWWAA